MKKTIMLLAICIGPLSTALAQRIEMMIEQSLEYFRQGDYGNFENSYPLLYDEYLKANLPEYQNALDATGNGDICMAIRFLDELIEDDVLLDALADDKNFLSLHESPCWKGFMERLRERKSGYDNELRLRLKAIQDRDQGIRILFIYGRGNIPDGLHDYMHVVDRQTAREICGIIDARGWVGPDIVGMEGNETLFLAIQHVGDVDVQEKYLPVLRDAVAAGDAEGWHLAFLTDRILMNQGKKQIYGSQKIRTEGGQVYIVPLEDPHRVDELRAAAGMGPLAEELEEDGIDWSLEQYLRELPEIENAYRTYYEALVKSREQ